MPPYYSPSDKIKHNPWIFIRAAKYSVRSASGSVNMIHARSINNQYDAYAPRKTYPPDKNLHLTQTKKQPQPRLGLRPDDCHVGLSD